MPVLEPEVQSFRVWDHLLPKRFPECFGERINGDFHKPVVRIAALVFPVVDVGQQLFVFQPG